MAILVQGMADLVSSTAGPRIKVVVEVTDDLPPASADPNQLEMAILNLSGYAETEGIASDLPRLTKPFRNADLAASIASLH